MATEEKVHFGLSNVHYAILTETPGEVESWGTPVAISGAVNLTLNKVGEVTDWHADNVVYYHAEANNGYSGSIEFARIPDQMLKDVWGFTEGATSKVLTEHADAEPKAVALLFKIETDQVDSDYALYKCLLSRPNIGSTTITNTKEPQTQSCDISVLPLVSNKVVRARTTYATPAQTKSGWYSAVFVEA